MKFLKFVFSLVTFILLTINITISIFTFFDSAFLTGVIAPIYKSYRISSLWLVFYGKYLENLGYWSVLINSILFILSVLFMTKSYRDFAISRRIRKYEYLQEDLISHALESGEGIKEAIRLSRKNGDYLSLGLLYLKSGKKFKGLFFLKDFRPQDYLNERDFLEVFNVFETEVIPFLEEWRKKSFFEKFLWRLLHFSEINPDLLDERDFIRKMYRYGMYHFTDREKYHNAFRLVENSGDLNLARELIGILESKVNKLKSGFDTTGMFFKGTSREKLGDVNPATLYRILEELYGMVGDEEKKVDAMLKQKKIRSAARELEKMGEFGKSAEILFGVGDYKNALRVLEKIEDSEKSIEDLFLKVKILFSVKEIKKSIKFLKKYRERFLKSGNFKLLMEVARISMVLRLGDVAKDFLEKAEKIDEIEFSKSDGPLWLSEIINEMKVGEIARKNLETYSETNPGINLNLFFEEIKDEMNVESFTDALIVNRYKIEGELGRGGAGVVYLAKDIILDRKVAIKELRRLSSSKDKKNLDNFLKEARVLAKLNHPNIVQVYDVFKTRDIVSEDSESDSEIERYFIVMEFVDGPSLENLIFNIGEHIDEKEWLLIIIKVLDGLFYAHSNDVLHLDIKPANILIDTSKTPPIPKITDFGIAMILSSCLGATQEFKGTPKYVAPEIITGGVIDNRADIYSIGITLFEIFTGDIPYSKNVKSVKEFLDKKAISVPKRPSEMGVSMDKRLEEIIMKAICHDIEKRYQSVVELKKDLENYLKVKYKKGDLNEGVLDEEL